MCILFGQFIIRDIIPTFNKKESQIQSNTLLQKRSESIGHLDRLLAKEGDPEVIKSYQELIQEIKLKIAASQFSEMKMME